ncbi:MAG: hypothetical protein KAJ97_10970 [Acidobacteria bacterium]|nr:hypothetical protein [Acidobacteriota bacterium]
MSESEEYGETGGSGTLDVGAGSPASGGGDPGSPSDVPFGQRLYDNTFFWLVAGFVIMAVVYTGWGLVEILTLPWAPLP